MYTARATILPRSGLADLSQICLILLGTRATAETWGSGMGLSPPLFAGDAETGVRTHWVAVATPPTFRAGRHARLVDVLVTAAPTFALQAFALHGSRSCGTPGE